VLPTISLEHAWLARSKQLNCCGRVVLCFHRKAVGLCSQP
jgi:hypothetical protein